MNITIGSAFRNSGGRAMDYVEQVAAFRDGFSYNVKILAVEGDSTDNTREALTVAAKYHRIPLDLVTCNHGGPMFGSTEEPARFKALSKVCDAIFGSVDHECDVFIYVESDLKWQPMTFVQLVRRATEYHGFDIIAPMVMAATAFYDIWGFRGLDGQRFSPFAPYHECYRPDDLFEVGSVGSCLAMRGHVARMVRVRHEYCLVGLCEDARNKGFRIAVDPRLTVRQL